MGSLWFKREYVEPILRGEKRDTIRASTTLRTGDQASASVGPRPPFARLHVTKVERIALAEIDDLDHRAAVRSLYPGRRRLVRIHFRIAKD